MNPRTAVIAYVCIMFFLFNSCSRGDNPVFTEGRDCQSYYQSEKKIHRIVATAVSGSSKTTEFSYTHNVVTGITVAKNSETAPGTFVIYYASGVCLPSGYNYRFSSGSKNYDLNGAFTIENTKVTKRIITRNYSDPLTSDSSTADAYGYDAAGRLDWDLPEFENAPLYDAVINIKYDAAGNVTSYTKLGGDQEAITSYEMDTHKNPFKQQDHLFYLMKLLPFVTIPDAVNDVFHYFSLNNSNPLRFRFIGYSFEQYEYTFEYTYTPDGFPTHINVFRAGFLTSPSTPDPTRVLQEQLDITYL